MTRIAVSIQTLTDEIHARSPLTTIYHYDNGPARDSDHDPNSYGVICACDIMQGHGLNLHDLSREIVASRHPECAYVIYNHQIASRNTGWEWVGYDGESDHEDHIHVSVGIGPDGYKQPPYDSTRPWLGDDMFTEEDRRKGNAVYMSTFGGGPSCGKPVDPENVVNGVLSGGKPTDPVTITADKYKNGLFSQLAQIRANQSKILAALAVGGDGCKISQEQLDALENDIVERLNTLTFVVQS